MIVVVSAASVSSFAADKVTFTRHAYDERGYLFQTYEAEVPFATYVYQPDRNVYDVVLMSKYLEPVYKFSIEKPKVPNRENIWPEPLKYVGYNSTPIQKFLVTQHLFNDDDLYEVIFVIEPNYDGSFEDEQTYYHIYNEKGDFLGEIPDCKLFTLGDEVFIYSDAEYAEGVDTFITALYSINKGGTSVNNLKANDARFQIMPNPAKAEETVTVTLPELATVDMIIKVYGIDGKMMVQRECKRGMQSVIVPASMLSSGINPVIAFDAEGNVVYSGKIARE